MRPLLGERASDNGETEICSQAGCCGQIQCQSARTGRRVLTLNVLLQVHYVHLCSVRRVAPLLIGHGLPSTHSSPIYAGCPRTNLHLI